MRDAERVPRHAVLAAAAPFGIPGGTRITVRIDHLDGTIGQGIRRVKLSATDATNPRDGADPRGRAVVPRRRTGGGSAEARRRPEHSQAAGDAGAPVGRAAGVPASGARKLL